MAISYDTNTDGGFLIKIAGNFDYTLHESFRKILDAAQSSGTHKLIIDMGEVEQVDGSAMGMLLLLRDNCGSENCDVTVTRCSPEILRLFKTANLDNYFNFR